jgi:hypothetical protein
MIHTGSRMPAVILSGAKDLHTVVILSEAKDLLLSFFTKQALRRCLRATLLLAGVELHAQESVLLRLHPKVGDTLRTVLEQQTEVTMPAVNANRMAVTTVAIHSQTVVRSVQQASTIVMTHVDSARMTSSDAHTAAGLANAQRVLEGQQMVLQLGADGTVQWARDARGALVSREIADAMSAMPAVFPRKPVSVGEEWSREMPLPSGGPLGATGSGMAKAIFRLDSLGRNASVAYVSMRGEIVADRNSRGVELNGTISGSMQLDRARGWMTDSKILILLKSLVTPPPSSGLVPMRFLTKVTQRLRTMDKR